VEGRRGLESPGARRGEVIGEPLTRRGRAFIAGSLATSKGLIGRPINGFAIAPVAVMVYCDSINAIGPHELCHAWANLMWGPSSGTWIDEGLAVHCDGNWQRLPLHGVAGWLLERGRLIPLGKLIEGKWSQKEYSFKITYPESGSLIKFLYENYGRETVKALWQGGASVPACEAVLGKPLRLVEGDWLRELSKVDLRTIQYSI